MPDPRSIASGVISSVSSSVSFIAAGIMLGLAHKNRIVADNIYILPADADTLTLAADAEKFRSAINYQRNHTAAAGIHLHIADKSQPASVGFVYNFLAPEFGHTAVHMYCLRCYTFEHYQYMPQK